MRKKIVLLVMAIVLTVAITYGEYSYIKKQFSEKPQETVFFTSQTIKKGDLLTKDLVIEKTLNASEVESSYIKDINRLTGTYAAEDIHKGEILLEDHMAPSTQVTFAKNKTFIWVTFEFDEESSNGWNLRENQLVKLLFAPKDGSAYTLYENVSVKRIYNKNGSEVMYDTSENLKYVTFEILAAQGYELVSKRDKGRIEIIIL